MVLAMSLGHGIGVTAGDRRCRPPPSSSAMTRGGKGGRSLEMVERSCDPSDAGGGAPPRSSSPPAPELTAVATVVMSKFKTGATITAAARRAMDQWSITDRALQEPEGEGPPPGAPALTEAEVRETEEELSRLFDGGGDPDTPSQI